MMPSLRKACAAPVMVSLLEACAAPVMVSVAPSVTLG